MFQLSVDRLILYAFYFYFSVSSLLTKLFYEDLNLSAKDIGKFKSVQLGSETQYNFVRKEYGTFQFEDFLYCIFLPALFFLISVDN